MRAIIVLYMYPSWVMIYMCMCVSICPSSHACVMAFLLIMSAALKPRSYLGNCICFCMEVLKAAGGGMFLAAQKRRAAKHHGGGMPLAAKTPCTLQKKKPTPRGYLGAVIQKKPASGFSRVLKKKPASHCGSITKKNPTMSEFELTVKYMSGEPICVFKVDPGWTVKRVKDLVQHAYIPLNQTVQSLFSGDDDGLLKDEDSLYNLWNGQLWSPSPLHTVLLAIVVAQPTLHLEHPCTAEEFCERHSVGWRRHNRRDLPPPTLPCYYTEIPLQSNGFNGRPNVAVKSHAEYCGWGRGVAGDRHIVMKGVEHCNMEGVSPVTQDIVHALTEASPREWPFRKCHLPFTTHHQEIENGEIIVITDPGDDAKLACFQALKFLDRDPAILEFPRWTPPLMQCTFLHQKDWNLESEGLYDHVHNLRHVVRPELVAITKIMATRLSQHFTFGFDEHITVAPVIHGGYTAAHHCSGGFLDLLFTPPPM